MENIKLHEIIRSSIAVDTNTAKEISQTILQRYQESHQKITIDFWDIKSVISEFIRTLVRPLVNNDIKFSAVNFSTEKSENMYNRIIEEFSIIGTDNIKETQKYG